MMGAAIHCCDGVCGKGLLIHRKRSPFPDKGRLNVLGFASLPDKGMLIFLPSLCPGMTRAGDFAKS